MKSHCPNCGKAYRSAAALGGHLGTCLESNATAIKQAQKVKRKRCEDKLKKRIQEESLEHSLGLRERVSRSCPEIFPRAR